MTRAKEKTVTSDGARSDRRKILIIDDNSAIHDDIGRVLREDEHREELDALEAEVFGRPVSAKPASPFVTESAYQGQEGLAMVKRAIEEGDPYMLAFVDMRMPPGWDGLETIKHIWEVDSEIQVVICTAFSDHSWDSIASVLGQADRLLILKKPFDVMEVTQLAWALTEKWILARRARLKRDQLERLVKVRTTSLEAARQELLILNQELAEARDRASAANHVKSEFLAAMSHEIRTPLNGVIGTTSLLMETELDQRQESYVEILSSSAEAMLTIINDLLDISKIEAGKMSLEHRSFDIRRAVDQVAEMLTTDADEKAIELLVRVGRDVPRCIVGDEVRIRQVLINLVGNAIKFTHEGHVLVNVVCRPVAEEGMTLSIAVEDTGIGIPEDKLALIFGAYDQADTFTAIRYGGTGLGLAISKKLCELMGGRITVASTVGKGSTFTMCLPLAVDRDNAGVPDMPDALADLAVVVLSPKKIMRDMLEESLAEWGVRATAARVVEEAVTIALELSRAAVLQPVIVVDQADGITDREQILLALRDAGLAEKVPVLLLTEAAQSTKARGSESCDYAAALAKPVRAERLVELVARVANAIKLGKSLTEVARENRRPQTHRMSLQGEPPQSAVTSVLLADDNDINRQVAAQMLQRLGCEVAIACDGQEAVDMYSNGSYDLILMDCEMPKVDGFEATRQIRDKESADTRTPIIAMTANAMTGNRQRCLDVGMDDYLPKPYRLKDLQAMLARWIAKPSK